MKTIDRQKALEKTCPLSIPSGEPVCCEGAGCMAWERRGPTAGACLLIPDAVREIPAFNFAICGANGIMTRVLHCQGFNQGCSDES